MSATVHTINKKPIAFISFFKATHTERVAYANFDRPPSDEELNEIDKCIKTFARAQGAKCWRSGRTAQGNVIDFHFQDQPSDDHISLYQKCFKRWSAQNDQ